jgi:hypothetical protein
MRKLLKSHILLYVNISKEKGLCLHRVSPQSVVMTDGL